MTNKEKAICKAIENGCEIIKVEKNTVKWLCPNLTTVITFYTDDGDYDYTRQTIWIDKNGNRIR